MLHKCFISARSSNIDQYKLERDHATKPKLIFLLFISVFSV